MAGRDSWAVDKKQYPSSQPGFNNPPVADFFKDFSQHALGQLKLWLEDDQKVVPASGDQTGWTVVLGDGNTDVVVGDYQAIWAVPRQIVGDGASNWFIYDPSAWVKQGSSTVDVEIWLYRVRNTGGTSDVVTSLLDSPLVIDVNTQSSRESASPVVVGQFTNLMDEDTGPNYDSIMVGIDAAGDATGLSINVPIGIEVPAGSGYRT